MKRTRFTEEQIIGVVKEVETGTGHPGTVAGCTGDIQPLRVRCSARRMFVHRA
jgi:hypothetical protein